MNDDLEFPYRPLKDLSVDNRPDALQYLVDKGYLEVKQDPDCGELVYRVTQAGRDADAKQRRIAKRHSGVGYATQRGNLLSRMVKSAASALAHMSLKSQGKSNE